MTHDEAEHFAETIYALSSGGLPSGIAVIRLSGPETRNVVVQLSGFVPPTRQAALRVLRDRNGNVLDQGLVLFFPGPASFTGEDCAELQVHGGRAVVSSILNALSGFPGLRHAQAGEFSRRAFQNGKLDLVEVEGLADLVAAETEMQRRLALEHSSGHLSDLYRGWSQRLTHARAMIEAELDFADEDDVPGSLADAIWTDMEDLLKDICAHIEGAGIAEIIRDGLTVVIAGEPNVGKSSLLNWLAKRDVAIVTDVPGTTRDVLSVNISLAGFSVRFVDTAGLREAADLVEKEGIRRAYATIDIADIVLLLSDDPERFPTIRETQTVVRVVTKIDMRKFSWDKAAVQAVSTKTGEGLPALLDTLATYLPDVTSPSALALPTRSRHVSALEDAAASLRVSLAQSDSGLDIRAEYLRLAAQSLGRITGRVDVEDLLDVIFSEFCIGK
ncbi:tRNA uridine-5-carboxymethylaminomethyl(34) synthesis GTPase MnmE [Pararhizobium gei]|uniref:tRNA uridine-5-carboxymethylaminomethyl(34) synthesis GTPase MnmE n=1 Tax=Pararhizobium gei TaxID=1395951 RepID=UPI0023DCBBB1|nr:tRNA uridine-5-carboxymethylaminomethyl(34) synthesis GTPase MnmE [Rhizobium gei]